MSVKSGRVWEQIREMLSWRDRYDMPYMMGMNVAQLLNLYVHFKFEKLHCFKMHK